MLSEATIGHNDNSKYNKYIVIIQDGNSDEWDQEPLDLHGPFYDDVVLTVCGNGIATHTRTNFALQIHSGDPADKVREAQEQ